MQNYDQEILTFIRKVRRRQREILMIRFGLYALVLGLGFAVLMALISLVIPFYYAVPSGIGGLMIILAAGLSWAAAKTPDLVKAALLADQKGLKERVVTAFGLQERTDCFSMLEKADTAAAIKGFAVNRVFPLQINKAAAAGLVVLTAALIGILSLPSAVREAAREQHLITAAATARIERVEGLRAELAEMAALAPVESSDLRAMLEETADEMRAARTAEELTKAEERFTVKLEQALAQTEFGSVAEILQAELEEQRANNAPGMKENDNQTDPNTSEGARQAARNRSEDFAQARESLKEAAENINDAAGRENAAGMMEDLAKQFNNNDLAQAAADLRNTFGDSTELVKAKLIRARFELEEAEDRLGQMPEAALLLPASDGENEDGGDSAGANQSGAILAGTQGNPAGNQNNGATNGTGGGWDQGSRSGQEDANKPPQEMVSIPGAAVGGDEDLTGRQNESGQSYTGQSDRALTWTGEKVDYNQVKAEYSRQAYEKVDSATYPGDVKEQIKGYFELLND